MSAQVTDTDLLQEKEGACGIPRESGTCYPDSGSAI